MASIPNSIISGARIISETIKDTQNFGRKDWLDIFNVIAQLSLAIIAGLSIKRDLDREHKAEKLVIDNKRQFFERGDILESSCSVTAKHDFIIPGPVSKLVGKGMSGMAVIHKVDGQPWAIHINISDGTDEIIRGLPNTFKYKYLAIEYLEKDFELIF